MSHRRTEKPSRLMAECEREDDDTFLVWYFGEDDPTEGDEIQQSAVAEAASMQTPWRD